MNMLSKKIVVQVKKKLIKTRTTRRVLAEQLGFSYQHLVNVLNRKTSSEALELLLKEWSEE